MNAIRNIIELKSKRINIDLPEDYNYKKVEIIILPYNDKEEKTDNKIKAQDFFSFYNLNLDNYKFNRDELYERR